MIPYFNRNAKAPINYRRPRPSASGPQLARAQVEELQPGLPQEAIGRSFRRGEK